VRERETATPGGGEVELRTTKITVNKNSKMRSQMELLPEEVVLAIDDIPIETRRSKEAQLPAKKHLAKKEVDYVEDQGAQARGTHDTVPSAALNQES